MELTLSIAIGVLTGSGVWLILRPRTYQLVIGLSLLSYAVNLFIFSMGRLRVGAAPVLGVDGTGNPADFAGSHSAGAGAHRHRDRFRHNGASSGGTAGRARPHGKRPCRRAGIALMDWTRHLLIVPILLPLVAGAALLLINETRHTLKALVSLISALLLLVGGMALMRIAAGAPDGTGTLSTTYAVADWPAPFAIVLVLDRLSALMLVLTSVVALASLTFSLARWHGAGPHFHSLFQFLLMGLGGAFLTGDLFNLFVFFEITLAAYGLLLHGSGSFRVRSGLHYISINLAASLLFLIGVSLIYGVTGTLNMADLASRLPGLPDEDRVLFEAGAAILGVAFLVKAGMWPLGFWLAPAYTAAAAPVGAIFVVLTKVGVYVLLRLTLLLFGSPAGELTGFGGMAVALPPSSSRHQACSLPRLWAGSPDIACSSRRERCLRLSAWVTPVSCRAR